VRGHAAAQDTAPATSSQPAQTVQQNSAGLNFVSSFSSAADVRGPLHPLLDRTLDIIAGPKDAAFLVNVLKSPSAVTADSDDRVFVADPGARAVHMFDFIHSKYGLLDGGNDRLGIPVSLAVDGQDNLYVVDERTRTVLVYDSAGQFRRYLGRLTGGESYFESPTGMAIDKPSGRIYVCDTHRHMIIVMDDRGRLIGKAGKRGGGSQPGDFRLPSRAVVLGGEVFVLDVGNTRIQIFDTDLHFLRAIDLAYADHRTGLAVDNRGDIYVSDPVLHWIQVFSREGRLLHTFDTSKVQGANFSHPSSMWISSGSCLYVVDSQSNRVGLFQISGENARQCR
jgi:DNA-binding beta-propeller fold protein YncE